MFDPDSFMSSSIEGASSTVYVPVPEGEFQAVVEETKVRDANGYVILDVFWAIDDPKVEEATGRDVNKVRQSIFLDMTSDGGLDMGKGKNVQLGKLREAIGQNTEGAWSPSMISGNVAMIRISHRMYEGAPQAEVKGVSAVA